MSVHADPDTRPTANERWKRRWEQVFWQSMIVAIVAHFAVFQFWPTMVAADIGGEDQIVSRMLPPPTTELPPPPAEIRAPATPVVAETLISDDVTIPPTNFDRNRPDVVLRPPPSARQDSSRSGGFTAFEIAPLLTNQRQVEQALVREYPSMLRDAGIGGVVQVVFSIDAEGKVLSTEIARSSGHPQLDEAALRVADLMKFSPAMNRDVAVPVRVTFPINFRVRESSPLPNTRAS